MGKRRVSVQHPGLCKLARRIAAVASLLAGLLLSAFGVAVGDGVPARVRFGGTAGEAAAVGTAPIYVVGVRGAIDLGVAPYVARALREAERGGAQAVLVEINTPGGRVDAVLQMRDSLLATPLRTIAFVDRTALSAGALVALSSTEIYLAPGAVMGAATPVDSTGEAGDEKVVSAIASVFRATAEIRGRDPRIAEAMVDPSVEISGLVERGQLLTLTTTEALARGFAEGSAASRQEVLRAAGLADAPVRETAPGLAENVVRFLTNPLVASLLISLGMLLIWGDVTSGGVGLVAAGGVGLLAIFFWGHYLAGLAGWEGVALVVAGLVLIAAEVLIIPGFGVAGILGAAAVIGGLFISLIGKTVVSTADLVRAGTTVGLALGMIAAGALALLRYLPGSNRLSGLVLRAHVGGADEATESTESTSGAGTGPVVAGGATERESLVGVTGVAITDLRPAGIGRLRGERVDVVTRGDYITAGDAIKVVADEGYRRVVRRIVGDGGESRVEAVDGDARAAGG